MKQETQYQLRQEVNVAQINIVTCGMCGDVLLHRMEDEDIKCPFCEFEGEPCDFPDLNYE